MLFIKMLISLEVKTHEISCPALLIPSGEIISQITKSDIAYKMMGTSTRVIGQENFNDSPLLFITYTSYTISSHLKLL